jgi:hypothetical protein
MVSRTYTTDLTTELTVNLYAIYVVHPVQKPKTHKINKLNIMLCILVEWISNLIKEKYASSNTHELESYSTLSDRYFESLIKGLWWLWWLIWYAFVRHLALCRIVSSPNATHQVSHHKQLTYTRRQHLLKTMLRTPAQKSSSH